MERQGLSRIWTRKGVQIRRRGPQLARHLNGIQLVPIGVGSTIGAGVYVLVGTVAREQVGPALPFSFLIAGFAAALSALCYAELASRAPSAGSAYHYAYVCVGEGLAWIIGWALILENTIGGSAVARGISPNVAILFGGAQKLPAWMIRREMFGIVLDPGAAILVLVVTILLCLGIRESAGMQAIMTVANIMVLLFVVGAGSYVGIESGWQGYHGDTGFLPYGMNGILAGAATLFFAFIGFDTVASVAEEVKNPQRDLPLGIGLTLLLCSVLYMMVSSVVVGVVPFNIIDVDTPMSNVFASHGMPWAMYIVSAGAVAALSTTLMGSIIPQPRILMAMARDGLLPRFFSRVNKASKVPVNGTLVTGLCASVMAFTMEVDQLAGMVSAGTLLAFVIVGVSILVLRYAPPVEPPITYLSPSQPLAPRSCPAEVPVKQSTFVDCLPKILESYGSASDTDDNYRAEDYIEVDLPKGNKDPLQQSTTESSAAEVVWAETPGTSRDETRRSTAAFSIGAVIVGAVVFSVSVSFPFNRYIQGGAAGLGVVCFAGGVARLSLIHQDEGQHTFGGPGSFRCPWIPVVPALSVLINVYLLVNLGGYTWIRFSIWLSLGIIVYAIYGFHNSVLFKESQQLQ